MERKIATRPIPVQRSTRRDEWRGLTSMRAGEIVPLAYFPLLREDRLRGRVSVSIRMDEAVELIINPIRIRVQAHLIPKSALPRFNGSLETLNRSYKGELMPDGVTAAPAWYVTDAAVAGAGNDDLGLPVYDKLGVHYKSTTLMHTDLVESYNVMVNWRRRAVSNALSQFNVRSHNLKPAFWLDSKFDHVKPSFDAAMIDGQVPLTVAGETYVRTKGAATNGPREQVSINNGSMGPVIYVGPTVTADAAMTVEFGAANAHISLANIALARETQAFAKLREQYQGLPDEYLIDLLMSGIRVPEQDLMEPVLLAMGNATINMQERYATDGDNLDVSVANGIAALSMTLNTPPINSGGVVLVTCEIVPEQLYERRADYWLDPGDGSAAHLPDYLRDYLDPQKVEVVPNFYADGFHSDPHGLFGYAPLNHRWQRMRAQVGGRFKRPVPDAFVQERQRIWQVETVDPTLTDDFYVCPQPFPHDPFADSTADPFEVVTVGVCEVVGNTVFGGRFAEAGGHYDAVTDQVDTTRLKGDGSDDPAALAAKVSSDEAEGGEA